MDLFHVCTCHPITISFPSMSMDVDAIDIVLLSTMLVHLLEAFFLHNPYRNYLLLGATENTLQDSESNIRRHLDYCSHKNMELLELLAYWNSMRGRWKEGALALQTSMELQWREGRWAVGADGRRR
eukprot:TRINITY_DN12600_c0_g3_i1.p1 TRINITY_DN12600_c0_g3~~TRINITY_DN12600_c0_g3_i1.p1  ORF type:complete len:126 (-),score=23.18 TRINITY_DN12600_c0_g3_i1:170-547(-)